MRLVVGLAAALLCGGAVAAEVERVILPDRLVRGNLNVRPTQPIDEAAWVWHPDDTIPRGGRFVKFRRQFTAVDGVPLKFHVSADERFVLILDGKIIARGPDRGVPEMWFYETFEARLASGEHLLEAIVWKLSPGHAPNAQQSYRAGFIFKAEGEYDAKLTTGKAPWQVAALSNTRMTRTKFPLGQVGAQCEIAGTDFLTEAPPAGKWVSARVVRSAIRANRSGSDEERAPGWLLYPSQLPAQLEKHLVPGKFVAADDQAFATNGIYSTLAEDWCSNGVYAAEAKSHPIIERANQLLSGNRALVIPPHTALRLLWDLGDYYCAYPELRVSRGKGAHLRWSWAEALFVGDCFDGSSADLNRKGKGSRADFAGKYFYGIGDDFRSDGRAVSAFTTPWWRCGRWCQLEIKTGDEPLELRQAALVETRYPAEDQFEFECDDPTIGEITRICRRGLQMCMHEMYFDCPYYEQQMYGGDTRVQMLIAHALGIGEPLVRQSFRLLEQSQRDSGMISMNFPTSWRQESTTYSLFWGMMLGDYARWQHNLPWVRARIPYVRKLLFGLENYVNAEGLVENLPGWSFVDWTPGWKKGIAPDGHFGGGESAINNLIYLLALQNAAAVERAIGEEELAQRWQTRAERLGRTIVSRFWCRERGLLADTVRRDTFSEHAQALAILAGILSSEQTEAVLLGLERAEGLAKCTVYFSHYLFSALLQHGKTDLFLKKLDIWRDYLAIDLKTPMEAPGDSRSDCHAWGAHPLYHLITGALGVRPDPAASAGVVIAPAPGSLKWMKAKIPHANGAMELDLKFDRERVSGKIFVPKGLKATFKWRGQARQLKPGETNL